MLGSAQSGDSSAETRLQTFISMLKMPQDPELIKKWKTETAWRAFHCKAASSYTYKMHSLIVHVCV